MTDAIEHRGPDAEGAWVSENAALGHRRLIVIDPNGGKQPMLYQNNHHQIALTYNGELYNYLELKEELTEKGHTFNTSSDTEVLLHSYLEWGEECVRHFNGIFAFGIWDEEKKQLMLGRDRLGVKPLFFTKRKWIALRFRDQSATCPSGGRCTNRSNRTFRAVRHGTYENTRSSDLQEYQ